MDSIAELPEPTAQPSSDQAEPSIPPAYQTLKPAPFGTPFTSDNAREMQRAGDEAKRLGLQGPERARLRELRTEVKDLTKLIQTAMQGRLITDIDKEGVYIFASPRDIAYLFKSKTDAMNMIFRLTGWAREPVSKPSTKTSRRTGAEPTYGPVD